MVVGLNNREGNDKGDRYNSCSRGIVCIRSEVVSKRWNIGNRHCLPAWLIN